MLGFIYVCGLALYCFMDIYDMLFWDDDAMLHVRCMLVCVCEFRIQVLKLFLIKLRCKAQ